MLHYWNEAPGAAADGQPAGVRRSILEIFAQALHDEGYLLACRPGAIHRQNRTRDAGALGPAQKDHQRSHVIGSDQFP